jgi:hypothetical protein
MQKETQLGGWGFMLGDFYKGGVLDEYALRVWLWKIANTGVNRWRFGPVDIWNGVSKIGDVFSPVMLVNGKWDWTQWNPEYFRVWKRIYELCNEYGIRPVRELLDNCQLKGGDAPRFSPFVTKVHGSATFYDDAEDKWTRAWIEKNFAEFAGLCDWGQCNEGTAGIIDLADRLLNPIFKEHGLVPFSYGICSTPGNPKGPLETLKARAATFFGLDANGKEKALWIFRQTHQCGSVADPDFNWPLSQWGKACPIAIGIFDDGEQNGDSTWDKTTYNGKTQTRPSEATWYAMVKVALLNKNNDLLLWFEHSGKLQNVDMQVKAYSAMAKAVYDVDKIKLSNIDKHPEPVKPAPPVEPKPKPKPDEPLPPAGKSWLRRNWGYPVALIVLIVLAILIF